MTSKRFVEELLSEDCPNCGFVVVAKMTDGRRYCYHCKTYSEANMRKDVE